MQFYWNVRSFHAKLEFNEYGLERHSWRQSMAKLQDEKEKNKIVDKQS